MSFTITQVVPAQAKAIAPLFDQFRLLNHQQSNLQTAEQYLTARLMKQESIIFAAVTTEKKYLGYVQLYPTYSSMTAGRILIMRDMFVVNEARRQGIASALLKHAAEYAKDIHAQRIVVVAEKDNVAAQHLCEHNRCPINRELISYELSSYAH